MKIRPHLVEAPTVLPISLNEFKAHLNLDVANEDFSIVPAIPFGEQEVVASFGLASSTLEITGKRATVVIEAGDCSAGTVTIKLQESVDGIGSWIDVETSTPITASNDNANHYISYDGKKPFIKVLATVATGACNFGVSIHLKDLATYQDNELTGFLEAATHLAENETQIKCSPQTWMISLAKFPCGSYCLPFRPVIEITSVKYFDSDNTLQTLDEDLYSLYDGSIVFEPNLPSIYARPNAVQIEFEAGYEDSIPPMMRALILRQASHFYKRRESMSEVNLIADEGSKRLMDALRWDFRQC